MADSAQLAAIERAVTSGTKLTGQLLSFAHRRAMRPERVLLQEQLPHNRELIVPAVSSKVSVEVQVDPDTAPVTVDISELELALINLAVNARDAMPGGGSLRIHAGNAAAGQAPGLEGRFVVISMQDSGSGVTAQVMERVFEPFFTTKEVGKGTGLGLSQVYGFCVRAGGTATFDSRVGEGSTVRMYLPAAAVAAETAPQPAPPRSAARRHERPLPGVRVLLVEDNAEVASATGGLLESMGCDVRQVENADKALDVLRSEAARFDIVLSDIVMGGALDGIDLAERVKAEHPALPIVLMSGYSDSLDRAGALGVTVLPKPCSPDALLAAIR